MRDPDATDPNPNLTKAEAVVKSVWAWGHIHTFLAGCTVGGIFMVVLLKAF